MAHVNPVIDAGNHYQAAYDYAERMEEAEQAMADDFAELAMKADANAFAQFATLVQDHGSRSKRVQTFAEVMAESLDYTNGPTMTEAMQLILNAAYGNLSPEVVKAQARDMVERMGNAYARVHAEVE